MMPAAAPPRYCEAQKDRIVDAVLYAMRSGCFFPVPEPGRGASVQDWIQWGALRNLHNAVADLPGRSDR